MKTILVHRSVMKVIHTGKKAYNVPLYTKIDAVKENSGFGSSFLLVPMFFTLI